VLPTPPWRTVVVGARPHAHLFFQYADTSLDYAVDGTRELDGDTITASSWSSPTAGLVLSDDVFTDAVATVWVSSPALDLPLGSSVESSVVNRIVTAGGRTTDYRLHIVVQA